MQRSTSQRVLDRFYSAMDPEMTQTLTAEQKESIDQALLTTTLVSRHPVDIRRSFAFLHRRYFVVFLLGHDHRKSTRETSAFGRVVSTLGITLGIVFCILSVLLMLYMIKSALGIDVFKNFHVGIWDWFLTLNSKMR